MYHIVYLTTNLIKNKIYVGVHSTFNVNDSYLGSGKILLRAIKKYGKENFKREILYYCLEENHMLEIESKIVNDFFIKRNDTYNLTLGGSKPPSHKGKHISEEHKQKISKNHRCISRPWTDDEKLNHKIKMKHIMQDVLIREKCSIAKLGKPGNKLTEEQKIKRSIKQKEFQTNLTEEQKQNQKDSKIGSKNGMFGRKFYNNSIDTICCIQGQEPEGFILGRLMPWKQ